MNDKNRKCFECDSVENVIRHHVVPRSKGGKRTIDLCQCCHDKVHGIEGRDISVSELTKVGLAKAKANGVKLGNPDAKNAWKVAQEGIRRRCEEYYRNANEVIKKYIDSIEVTDSNRHRKKKYTLNDISEYLMSIGYKTPRGGSVWTATTARRVMKH